MNIKSSKDSLLLPEEIWYLKELKHLQVTGGRLPNRKRGPGLLNLLALLDLSAKSCRKEVLEWTPNIKRLHICIELAPMDEGDSFHYLNNISCLGKLQLLKCVVVNPRIESGFVPPVLMLPLGLKRLSLSGCEYPWEYMCMIGNLKNLKVLKLKRYAFQGATWEMNLACQLEGLKCLVIEDTNLVCWKITSPIPTSLNRISIKHCYKLQELPSAYHIQLVKKIEIVDCNSSTQTWARDKKREMTSYCRVEVDLSWNAGTIKKKS